MKEIHLNTQEEMCEKANSIDIGFHEEQKPRFTFRGYLVKVFGKWCGRFNININW